jgi:UbiD family decarboxylase
MSYDGLRDWLVQVEAMGELRMLEEIDWNLEMGAVVDVLYREHPPYPPALVFDKIKDHAAGFRALFGHFASPKRIALTLGMTEEFDHVLEFVRVYYEKMKRSVPIPMEEVKTEEFMKMCRREIELTSSIFPRPCFTKKMAAAISARVIWSSPKTRTLTGSMLALTGSCCTINIRREFISVLENTPASIGRNILTEALRFP